MKTELIETAKELAKSLPIDSLKAFAITCPDEILPVVLDELESRMTESEFVALCNEL